MGIRTQQLVVTAIVTSFLLPVGSALLTWFHVESHHHANSDAGSVSGSATAILQAELAQLAESATHGHDHDSDQVRHEHLAEPPTTLAALTLIEGDSATSTAPLACPEAHHERAPVANTARPPPSGELFRLHCALLL